MTDNKITYRLFEQLGSGQFGNVMKGVWLLSGGSKDVAMKILKEGSSEDDKIKFIREAAIHGQFWHPNIVKLMGVVTVGEPVSGVCDFSCFFCTVDCYLTIGLYNIAIVCFSSGFNIYFLTL